jgi:hypothetical protein
VTTAESAPTPLEWVTTAGAATLSTGLYLVYGAPYLARGVVGDSLGFAVLAVPLVARRRRLRHEALVCLAGIGVVSAAGADWPLRLPSAFWWSLVAVELAAYLALRRAALSAR